MLHYMCWSLSPVSIKKKKKSGMGYQEKKWTHEGPSIEKKRRRKNMDT